MASQKLTFTGYRAYRDGPTIDPLRFGVAPLNKQISAGILLPCAPRSSLAVSEIRQRAVVALILTPYSTSAGGRGKIAHTVANNIKHSWTPLLDPLLPSERGFLQPWLSIASPRQSRPVWVGRGGCLKGTTPGGQPGQQLSEAESLGSLLAGWKEEGRRKLSAVGGRGRHTTHQTQSGR